jgi:hypothetical protein
MPEFELEICIEIQFTPILKFKPNPKVFESNSNLNSKRIRINSK